MVGPMSTDERESLVVRMKVAFVVLIGASAGLITLLGSPTLLESGLVTGAGLLFGALVVRVVFPGTGTVERRER